MNVLICSFHINKVLCR